MTAPRPVHPPIGAKGDTPARRPQVGLGTRPVDLAVPVRRHDWDDHIRKQGAGFSEVRAAVHQERGDRPRRCDLAPPTYAAIDEWFGELARDDKLRGGEELQPSNTATTIRPQEGRPLVTDGPFMESKENVAGFVTIDVADLDEAIAIAKKLAVRGPDRRDSPGDRPTTICPITRSAETGPRLVARCRAIRPSRR